MNDEAKPARQRRRRSKDATYDEPKEGERKDDPDSGSAEAKPRASKSGWGMTSSSNEPSSGAKADSIESVGAGRRRANFGSTGNSSTMTHSHAKNRHFEEDDETSEVMEIPDLEEDEVDEDITAQVAAAPRNITRTVPTMKELNQRIKYSLPSAPVRHVERRISRRVDRFNPRPTDSIFRSYRVLCIL